MCSYRGFRSLTKECHAAKLFSKHMKVEEQVGSLSLRFTSLGSTFTLILLMQLFIMVGIMMRRGLKLFNRCMRARVVELNVK